MILLLVSGCASISKEECKTGDWNGIGFKDGSAGKKIARIQGYIEECGKHGATVDRAAYEKGRNEGLKTYCSKDNGFRVGKDGSAMFDECPAAMRPTFMKAWSMGNKIYELNKQLKNIESEMEGFEKRLDDPATTAIDKSTLRSRIRELQRNRDELNRDITKAELVAEQEFSGAE